MSLHQANVRQPMAVVVNNLDQLHTRAGDWCHSRVGATLDMVISDACYVSRQLNSVLLAVRAEDGDQVPGWHQLSTDDFDVLVGDLNEETKDLNHTTITREIDRLKREIQRLLSQSLSKAKLA